MFFLFFLFLLFFFQENWQLVDSLATHLLTSLPPSIPTPLLRHGRRRAEFKNTLVQQCSKTTQTAAAAAAAVAAAPPDGGRWFLSAGVGVSVGTRSGVNMIG